MRAPLSAAAGSGSVRGTKRAPAGRGSGRPSAAVDDGDVAAEDDGGGWLLAELAVALLLPLLLLLLLRSKRSAKAGPGMLAQLAPYQSAASRSSTDFPALASALLGRGVCLGGARR